MRPDLSAVRVGAPTEADLVELDRIADRVRVDARVVLRGPDGRFQLAVGDPLLFETVADALEALVAAARRRVSA
jgi:hypothetical protein